MFAVLLVPVLLGSTGVDGSAAAPFSVETLLAGVRCESAVREQLSTWDAQLSRAVLEPALPTGGRSARAPAAGLGLWVRIVEEAPRQVALERISSTRVERLRFDEECATSEYAVAAGIPPPGAFGDADLITLLARTDRGVILLWSPHVPLSVDQHAVLAAVARDLGLAVVPLLDPAADPEFAAQVAHARGLPVGATRPLGGIELAFRGMATDIPSLQVFAGGDLVGPVLVGYRGEAALRVALEREK